MSRTRKWFLSLLSVLAIAPASGAAACNNYSSAPATVQPTPTSTPTPMTATLAPVPTDAVVVVSLFDVTSSAIRFQEEAKLLLAGQLQMLVAPGRGGFQFVAGTISSNSFDAANTKLAARVAGLPPKPVVAPVSSRPSAPDLTTCQQNPFGRTQCEAKLTSGYTARLNAVLDEETRATATFDEATAAWQQTAETRTNEVASLAAQLSALPLTLDSTGTDIWGGLLRAAETLSTSSAPRKLLLVASDWLPSGRQQEGELHFPAGTIVKAVFYDCVESRGCLDRKRTWTEKLVAAGAERVLWLDPGASRLQADIFTEVTN
ncbi:MAG: hypothetical protein IT300_03885 [Dehalococcoidia bacterium]|nr:hypothetical protein [Dehalococcoidia bacterium]